MQFASLFLKAILVMRLKGFQGGLSVRVFLDSKLDGRIFITKPNNNIMNYLYLIVITVIVLIIERKYNLDLGLIKTSF